MNEWGVKRFDEELSHHGVKGQKWGVRRFDYVKKGRHSSSKEDERTGKVTKGSSGSSSSSAAEDANVSEQEALRKEKLKKIAKYVAIGAGVALGSYGLYKLSSINSQQKAELLNKVSAIDKNVSVNGWNREVQNKLQAKTNKYGNLASELIGRSAKANLMKELSPFDEQRMSVEEIAKHKAKYATEIARANLASQAASILYEKNNNDLNLYKQLDPRNVTKGEAIKKVFKSTTGAVKESAKDAWLTAAARKAKEEEAAVAANAIKEIQKIQVNDAKKIMKLYEQDPEKFLSGETQVLDYAKYSANKIEKLRELAGI